MLSKEFIEVLKYLSPGILFGLILANLSFRQKSSNLLFIMEALFVTTILNKVIPNNPSYLIYIFSIILAVVMAVFINKGIIDNFFICLGITNKTNKLNTWIELIEKGCYYEFRLKDNSAIMGKVYLASETIEEGLICIEDAHWIRPDKNEDTQEIKDSQENCNNNCETELLIEIKGKKVVIKYDLIDYFVMHE
jgi:hypothetical protein